MSNVSAASPDFETVDRKASDVTATPPSSDLGE